MEARFIAAWQAARAAAQELGVRQRPLGDDPMRDAHRQLQGNRVSDGFDALCNAGVLHLSLEALAVDKRFTALFSDDEVNSALIRLLDAGHYSARR